MELDRAAVVAQTASHLTGHCVEHIATDCSQMPISKKQGDTSNKHTIVAMLPMIVQVVENFCLTRHVRAQADCGYNHFSTDKD